MKLSIIIPVYNEVNTLREILAQVQAVTIEKHIILVDDFSTDGTRDLYPELSAQVDKIVLHDVNKGKGAAIRTGLEHATGDVTVIQDADLEYDPQEYHVLIQPILDGKADVVYGSRFLGGRPHRVLYFWHTVGNKVLTLFSNMMTNMNLTDMETCYKMARTELFRQINIEQNRFGFEPEITAKFSKMRGIRIYEVGISYDGRSYAAGKKIGWKDGVNAIWCIMKYARGSGIDVGRETLEKLEDFHDYSHWILQQFNGHYGESVREIGAGIGNNIAHLAASGKTVVATDYREDYTNDLRNKFTTNPNVTVELLDIETCDFANEQPQQTNSILCLNVLEHIKDDKQALRNMHTLLDDDGKLLLFVPAHAWLFSPMDTALGHYRRYDRAQLTKLLKETGFDIIKGGSFNTLGAIGWWISGIIFRSKTIKSRHVRGQKFLLPLSKLIDKLHLPFGLSIYAIAKKRT